MTPTDSRDTRPLYDDAWIARTANDEKRLAAMFRNLDTLERLKTFTAPGLEVEDEAFDA